jgi:hypothetical protein
MKSEVKKYNGPGSDKFKIYEGIGKTTGNQLRIKVGTERFLGPKVFFSPEKLTKTGISLFTSVWTALFRTVL